MAELVKTARIGDPLPAVAETAMRAVIPCDAGCATRTAAPDIPTG